MHPLFNLPWLTCYYNINASIYNGCRYKITNLKAILQPTIVDIISLKIIFTEKSFYYTLNISSYEKNHLIFHLISNNILTSRFVDISFSNWYYPFRIVNSTGYQLYDVKNLFVRICVLNDRFKLVFPTNALT